MKVVFATDRPFYPVLLGGAARHSHALLQLFTAKHGDQCVAVCPLRRDDADMNITDLRPQPADYASLGIRGVRETDAGVEYDCGYPIHFARDFWGTLDRLLRKLEPDVVFTSEDGPIPIARAAAHHGIPTLWYVQNHDFASDAELRTVKALHGRIATVSEYCRDALRQRTGIDAAVVYPAIRAEDYRVTPAPDPNGALTLLHAAQVKGVDTFFGFAAQLPDLPFELVEGWPTGDAWAGFAARCAALGNVRGTRRQADMAPVYRRMRILLVPSVWEEAAGRVVLEAHASGIPAVVSRRGGLPEMLGEGGILVDDYANPDAWAKVLRELCANPARLQELSEKARQNVMREEMQLEGMARRFHDELAATAGLVDVVL